MPPDDLPRLTPFDEIYARAAARKGGKDGLEEFLPSAKSGRPHCQVSRVLACSTD